MVLIIVLSWASSFGQELPATTKENKLSDSLESKLKKTNSGELTADLKGIRENFKRINSTKKWEKVQLLELDESTEGGEATFYSQGDVLEKIITKIFGETYQKVSEYYLKEGQLSFVYGKIYRYNRPITWDSIAMKLHDDNEVFDFDKSEIIEYRSYFKKGKLIKQVNEEKYEGSDFLIDEKRQLKLKFEDLLGRWNEL